MQTQQQDHEVAITASRPIDYPSGYSITRTACSSVCTNRYAQGKIDMNV